jgi:hypothetical protein
MRDAFAKLDAFASSGMPIQGYFAPIQGDYAPALKGLESDVK